MGKLEIWREGMGVVKAVYKLTAPWPKEELYGLTAQVRRAAVSVPTNIAEGIGRGTTREAAHFAQIALGSAYELDTLLRIAADLGLADAMGPSDLRQRLSSLARRISTFIRYKKARE